MEILIPVVLVLSLIVIGVTALLKWNERREAREEAAWRAAAERLGLRLGRFQGEARWGESVDFVMEGDHDGVAVKLRAETRPGGMPRDAPIGEGLTAKEALLGEGQLPTPLPAGFRLSRRGLGALLRTAVGDPGISTGDTAFDERFEVRAADPDHALRVITPEARERLIALSPHVHDITLEGQTLRWSFYRKVTEEQRLIDLAQRTAAIVRAFEEGARNDTPFYLPEALDASDAPQPEVAPVEVGAGSSRRRPPA